MNTVSGVTRMLMVLAAALTLCTATNVLAQIGDPSRDDPECDGGECGEWRRACVLPRSAGALPSSETEDFPIAPQRERLPTSQKVFVVVDDDGNEIADSEECTRIKKLTKWRHNELHRAVVGNSFTAADQAGVTWNARSTNGYRRLSYIEMRLINRPRPAYALACACTFGVRHAVEIWPTWIRHYNLGKKSDVLVLTSDNTLCPQDGSERYERFDDIYEFTVPEWELVGGGATCALSLAPYDMIPKK